MPKIEDWLLEQDGFEPSVPLITPLLSAQRGGPTHAYEGLGGDLRPGPSGIRLEGGVSHRRA